MPLNCIQVLQVSPAICLHLVPELDDGTRCPACPVVRFHMIPFLSLIYVIAKCLNSVGFLICYFAIPVLVHVCYSYNWNGFYSEMTSFTAIIKFWCSSFHLARAPDCGICILNMVLSHNKEAM